MNILGLEKAAGLLRGQDGKAPEPQEANLIIAPAHLLRAGENQSEGIFYLGQTLALKAKQPDLRVGLIGCVAQQRGEAIGQAFAGLDLILGTRKIHRLISHLADLETGQVERCVDIDMDDDPLPVEVDAILQETSFRAFVTIMEGCDNFCAYIGAPHPGVRNGAGHLIRILDEVRRLVEGSGGRLLETGVNSTATRPGRYPSLPISPAGNPGRTPAGSWGSAASKTHEQLFWRSCSSTVICNQLRPPAQVGSRGSWRP